MRELGTLLMVRMDLIKEPGHQLREKITEEGLEELSKSMAKVGLENPIKLRKDSSGYEIVSGHRRYLAAKDLGWGEIPAIIEEVNDENTRLRSIHENLHREDMSPIEEGRACKALVDEYGYSIKDVAKLCAKSESWVFSRVALLEMPLELQEAVDVGALSVSAVRELAAITDDGARAYYTEYAIKQGATAQLCAFWRGRWELEKITHDPSEPSDAARLMGPPSFQVMMPCNWCDLEYPIQIIDHMRLCPKCLAGLLQAKAITKQEEVDAARSAKKEVVE